MTQEERDRVIAQARAEHERIVAEATANRDRVVAEPTAQYDRIYAEAWAEFQRVVAEARAEFQRVVAPATAEYERAITEANAKRVWHPITNQEQRSVYKKVESVAMENFRSAVINHPGSGIAAQRIRKQAQAEYDQAIAQALAEYKRVTGEDYKP
jgi:cell division septum initiation protein DivIVA